ncbi:MAG: hypothetical protein KatS3mg010_2012 [Acidimicrobiia bacterium]|nr:MAG: hypothetical protein KatS3mg009_2124 [Acidimicrobiia bacterium]GIU90913.1 MAG: hypothetical protein KatS3mg010_2012 [Acidimicrobiia bacterium]
MADAFLVDTGLVVVHGPDAASFLQSQLSQDLDPLGDGTGVEALLLQPQGKLVAPLFVLRVSEGEWWCLCDAGFGTAVAEGLRRFRVRVRAEIDDRSGSSARLAVRARGGTRDDAAAVLGAAPGDTVGGHGAWRDARVVRGVWAPAPDGIDVVGPRATVAAARDALVAAGFAVGGEDGYEAARVAAGVPRMGRDLDERTIPQEAFLERRAVSFTKGCFVGQELVCRIDARGHVNRLLRRVRAADGPVEAGAEVVAGGRAVGRVTSAAGREGLAMVRREVEPPARVVLDGPAGRRDATVEAL